MLAAACVLGPDLGVSGLAAYPGCVANTGVAGTRFGCLRFGGIPWVRGRPGVKSYTVLFPTLWLQSSSSVSTPHAEQVYLNNFIFRVAIQEAQHCSCSYGAEDRQPGFDINEFGKKNFAMFDTHKSRRVNFFLLWKFHIWNLKSFA